MKLFQFDWSVSRNGYEIEERRRRRGSTFLTDDSGFHIVRIGDTLDPTRPFEYPALCRRLAACPRTPEDVLQFVKKYGFLTKAGARSERVNEIYECIDGATTLVRLVDNRKWGTIKGWLDEASSRSVGVGGVGRLGLILDFEPNEGGLILRLRPGSLLSAAYVQLLMEATHETLLRKCQNPTCDEYFTYGPGTGRRETRRYHSPQCQNRHTYLKRKEAAK